jgi:hypothetical protein
MRSVGLVDGQSGSAPHDGQRDFDFNLGTWHTHIRRILHPLSGSGEVMELNGIVRVSKVWGGRAQVEEIEADGPKGHWEGLTLFLYSPEAHQWSQTFANSKSGVLATPLIGEFKNGRGELYCQDTVEGRSVLVRGVWSDITRNSHTYQESYSADGGKTWVPAFRGELTRVAESDATTHSVRSSEASEASSAAGHEFDFDLGTWNTQITRRVHPLTGSDETIRLSGTVTVRKLWGGRGQLEEIEADGPKGHWEGMTVFLYDPQAHQWSMNFANSSAGRFTSPMIGGFENGRGELFGQDTLDGRSILVRAVWSDFTPRSHTYQEFYSTDGGQTWVLAFTAKKTKE